MNIVIVIDAYDVHSNGTSVSAQRFCEQLARRGHDIRIVSAGDGRGEYDVGKFKVPFFQKIIDEQGSAIALSGKKTLEKALDGADIVHVYQAFPLEITAMRMAKKRGIPVVGAFHMQPENILYSLKLERVRGASKLVYRLFNSILYRHTPHIHCPSEFIASQLRKNGYGSELHVISNGVSEVFCPGGSRRPERWGDKLVILSVGRLSREKRHDVLINAIAKSQLKENIHLVIAGMGPEKNNLQKLADSLGISIEFGYFGQKDLINIMRSADLYVHPADVEIEAIACLEAISCGLAPVISDSQNSAANQFALSEDNKFNAGRPEDLAAKIDYWLGNGELRKESGALHSRFAISRFGLSASIDAIERVYMMAITEEKAKVRAEISPYESFAPDEHVTKSWTPLNKKITAKTRIINFTLPFVFMCYLLRLLAIPLLALINKAFLGLRIEGMDKLKELRGRGAITVANHVHSLDASFVSLGVLPRRLQISSLKSNFEIPVIRWLVRLLGGFPIPEDTAGMMKFAKDIGKALGKGQLVHFYPEAALWPYHKELRPFKNGAFRFAVQFDAPVLPCVIVFRERNLHRKPAAKLIILDPVEPPDKKLGSMRERTEILKNEVHNRMYSTMEEWYELKRAAN